MLDTESQITVRHISHRQSFFYFRGKVSWRCWSLFFYFFFINYFNLKKGRGEPRRPAPLVDADFCRSRRPTVYVHTVLCHLQPYYYYITLPSMKFLSYKFICAKVSCKHCSVYEYKYIILNFFNFYWRDIDNVTLKVCFIL